MLNALPNMDDKIGSKNEFEEFIGFKFNDTQSNQPQNSVFNADTDSIYGVNTSKIGIRGGRGSMNEKPLTIRGGMKASTNILDQLNQSVINVETS